MASVKIILHPYPAYKPSGIDLLGDIPVHWEARRLKQVASLNPSRAEARSTLPDYTPVVILPMERVGEDGSIDQSETRPAHEVWNGFTYFMRGDVLVAKITPCFENGKGAHLDALRTDVGFGSTEFHVLRANGVASPQFLYRLTTTQEFRRQGADAMTGAAGQQRVPASFVANYAIPVPPLAEQAAIVCYLDEADHRIRRAISAKERLIDLLTEQRQAIIHRAVTRGLDPNVRFKDSGLEWLGDVPAHWKVIPIKRAFVSMDYGISESASDSGTIRLLTMGHLNQGRVTVPSTGGVDAVDKSLLLKKGDLLFNRTNSQELVGKVGLFAGHPTPVTFASYLVRLRPNSRNISEYLNAVLNDVAVLSNIRREAIPSLHQSNLNPTRYGRIKVSLPPLNEQIEIVEHLGKATADIDSAIANAERQLELLGEYRAQLVADVVTGRVDVRGALRFEWE